MHAYICPMICDYHGPEGRPVALAATQFSMETAPPVPFYNARSVHLLSPIEYGSRSTWEDIETRCQTADCEGLYSSYVLNV